MLSAAESTGLTKKQSRARSASASGMARCRCTRGRSLT
jgi:hypothetical protein